MRYITLNSIILAVVVACFATVKPAPFAFDAFSSITGFETLESLSAMYRAVLREKKNKKIAKNES